MDQVYIQDFPSLINVKSRGQASIHFSKKNSWQALQIQPKVNQVDELGKKCAITKIEGAAR